MDFSAYRIDLETARAAARAAAQIHLRSSLLGACSLVQTAQFQLPPLEDEKVRALLGGALASGDLFSSAPDAITDVAGNLVFRDFRWRVDADLDLLVRTFANRVLGGFIASVSLAPPRTLAVAIQQIEKKAKRYGLGRIRRNLVCYAYPRLGMVLEGGTHGDCIIDVDSLKFFPLSDESRWHCWRPFDGLTEAQVKQAIEWADAEEDRLLQITYGTTPEEMPEHKIPMRLVVQEGQNLCAIAASTMILRHHGISATQRKLLPEFGNPERIRMAGTSPTNQVAGLNKAGQAKGLQAEIVLGKSIQQDWNRLLPRITDEINHNRPIQRQLKVPSHVDVMAGWRGEAGTTSFMLWIYDPVPPRGQERLDRWDLMAPNINHLIFLGPPG